MRRIAVVPAIFALVLGGCECGAPPQSPTDTDPSDALRTQLGTNLDFLVDWSTAMPFVDLMRTSRPWFSGTLADWEGGPEVALDEHGWVRSLAPGQVVRTLMAWDMTTHPAGRYVVLWSGSGELDYFAGASGRRVEAESGPHRDVLDLDPRRDGPGIGLAIVRSDPSDPIRDIRVLVPGGACSGDDTRFCDAAHPCEDAGECRPFEEIHEAQVFHPTYLRSLAPYSALRFMNWADANSTITPTFEERWSDRTELTDARWGPRAPLEVMIDLANRVHAEPWLSLPSRADDDYARRAGALVRQRLDPSLRVWVEYSNEVWNTMFPQAEYARSRGTALGLADDRDLAGIRYYSRRSGELHRAFGDGFGDASRMIRVYAGQSASSWLGEQMLDFEGAATRADAYAIAPYFGHTVQDVDRREWAALSLDEFFARAERESLPLVQEHIATHARIARDRNLSLVGYEGGQHFVGYASAQEDPRINALFAAANRDPRMEDLYARYLAIWREEGGGVLMHLVDCAAGGPHGFWGASEYLGQPLSEAPKRRALLEYARTTQR
ncbi:MAG: hypothetical protein M3Y87_26820 [Myxococcota bacterium]|nr:hypothetical protein [Myxococcota bacterium]